ncbi:MAG: glycerol-3-phosphate 1-O-acyltransferase PlsY [Tepidisphaeraceae bacterium]|jgi:glycerol-3-phosphate acyltransferase PlsY
MTQVQVLLILIPAAYLIGSVPFGLIVGLAKGVDPRKAGSGNIGATNVGRLLGRKFFFIVFTLDLLKGAVPTLAAGAILNFTVDNRFDCLLWVLVAFGALFGHMASIFLKFKGGKGVATSAGVLLGIFPYFTLPGLVAVAVWGAVFAAMRYISAASIVGAASFPLLYILLGIVRHWPLLDAQLPFLIFSLLVPALIIFKHRANITRLRAGTELRAGGAGQKSI